MQPRYTTLGEFLFKNIENNEYLNELYETILFNYSMKLMGEPHRNKPIKKEHALRFADILSKSYGHPNSESHRSWAQEIVALLLALYPNDSMVKAYASSVLESIGNYRGLELIKSRYKNTSFLDELYRCFDLEYLEIPHQEDKFFFHSQKEIYNHLEDPSFSYSGPTSMGKSLIMRMFIKDKIVNGFKGNFAILVPTKALISEIANNIINKDLKEELSNKNYKVVTSGNSLFFKQEGLNYIMIMTPERFLYTLMSYPEISINYLFIDEAHKIGEKDGRATFYFKVIDMLMQRTITPHIILASPNIPNPEIYLSAIPNNESINSFKTSFTPVSQMKYVLDTTTNKFKVYNAHSLKDDPFMDVFNLDSNDLTLDIIRKLINKDLEKSNLVYCSGRKKAVDLALEYAKTIKKLDDIELNEIAKEIKKEIHNDYYLADLISKGVAYHVGYLPMHIRSKIEELYKQKKIKTLFCTSTLIEGVNLPADNLIIISCRLGARGNMSKIEFKNLIGRVGRIEFNLYGNVFIIKDKNMADKTINELLTKPVENQNIGLKRELSPQIKKYIIDSFVAGRTEIKKLPKQNHEEYDLMRKVSLILLKDIVKERKSVVLSQFADLLTPEITNIIKTNFPIENTSKPKPDDDINVSLDQTENLIKAINNGLCYPEINEDRINYYDLFEFLKKLHSIFKWNIYEERTIGNIHKLSYYSVVLVNWMNGHGLAMLLENAIKYNKENRCGIQIDRHEYRTYDDSQEHKNLVIGDTLQIIQDVILFSISNYFLKFSTEYKRLKTDGLPFENDWYEFVEYGSSNPLTIFIQRNGISRETADYIRNHQQYVVQTNGIFKLKKSILECEKQSVIDEIKDIMFNVPELFVE